jgi:hypothetical protein
MSTGSDGNGRQPPPDDRTLLDPLSHEELKALREARQRMQAKKKAEGQGSAVKHHIVIGPEEADGAPDTEPPARPQLPKFDGDVTLDQLKVSSPQPSRPEPPPTAEPMADQPTLVPGSLRVADVSPGPTTDPDPAPPIAPQESGPYAGTQPPPARAGQTGFGENTMMWMKPVKAPEGASSTAPNTMLLPKVSPAEKRRQSMKTIGLLAIMVFVIGTAAYLLRPVDTGAIEIHTNPPSAALYIDGNLQEQTTPARLANLTVGEHTFRLEKEGYEPKSVTMTVESGDGGRRDVDLVPISNPGMMTVGIAVEPVAARVTIDEAVHEGVRTLQVANVDPNREHRIRVEANGYLRTEQIIPPGGLKNSYRFTLEPDSE